MIYTITLNPALDRTLWIEKVRDDVSNRIIEEKSFAGGKNTDPRAFLERLHDQIHIIGAEGKATGRNIHPKPLAEAVRLCNAIYAVAVENAGVDEAYRIYLGD
jgi:fructose-1-phosphate kinase PfkB-like protein